MSAPNEVWVSGKYHVLFLREPSRESPIPAVVDDARRYVLASEAESELSSLRASLSRVTAERDEANAKVQFMVNRAADEKLDGYRELGARAAAAENERDEVLCLLDEAIECASHIETNEPDEAWGCWLRELRARVAARKGA